MKNTLAERLMLFLQARNLPNDDKTQKDLIRRFHDLLATFPRFEPQVDVTGGFSQIVEPFEGTLSATSTAEPEPGNCSRKHEHAERKQYVLESSHCRPADASRSSVHGGWNHRSLGLGFRAARTDHQDSSDHPLGIFTTGDDWLSDSACVDLCVFKVSKSASKMLK